MWKLIRFQSLSYLKYMIPLMVFLLFYFFELNRGGKVPVFFFLCFWAFLLVSGSLTTSEKYEETHNGYRILGALPVTNREIVGAKFILVLGAVILVTGFNITLLLAHSGSMQAKPTMVMIGVLWGIFCLLYGAVLYVGIFKFGYARMTNAFWIFFIILLVLLIFFLGDILDVSDFHIGTLHQFAKSLVWIPLPLIGLWIYYRLYECAVKVKEASEEV